VLGEEEGAEVDDGAAATANGNSSGGLPFRLKGLGAGAGAGAAVSDSGASSPGSSRGPGLRAGHPGGGSLAFYKARELQQQQQQQGGGGVGSSGSVRRTGGSVSPRDSPTGSPR